jgi:hypothetical protein
MANNFLIPSLFYPPTVALTARAGGGAGGTAVQMIQANLFATVASAGDSAQLPSATGSGLAALIANQSGNAMAVFPQAADRINNSGAGASASLAANHADIIIDVSVGRWVTVSGWLA